MEFKTLDEKIYIHIDEEILYDQTDEVNKCLDILINILINYKHRLLN